MIVPISGGRINALIQTPGQGNPYLWSQLLRPLLQLKPCSSGQRLQLWSDVLLGYGWVLANAGTNLCLAHRIATSINGPSVVRNMAFKATLFPKTIFIKEFVQPFMFGNKRLCIGIPEIICVQL